MDIVKLHSLPTEILNLVSESEREGYRFVRRLVDEYENSIGFYEKLGYAPVNFPKVSHEKMIGWINK